MQAVKGVSHVISWEVFTKTLQLWGSGHWARKAKLTLTKFLLTLFKYCLELFGDLSFLQNEKKTNMSTSEAACAPTHACSQTHTHTHTHTHRNTLSSNKQKHQKAYFSPKNEQTKICIQANMRSLKNLISQACFTLDHTGVGL